MDEKFMTKHQKIARGLSPQPIPESDGEFGVKHSKGSQSYEAVGNTEERKEHSYGAGGTIRGPGP